MGSATETGLNYTCIWRLLRVCAWRGRQGEENKAAKVGGPLCRISCQLHWAHILPLLSLSLVPSVNCTCWIWMYYCLFPPTPSLARSPWLQSEFQPSGIKYASPAACGAFTISNQQMPPSLAFFYRRDKKKTNTCKQTENCTLMVGKIESDECRRMCKSGAEWKNEESPGYLIISIDSLESVLTPNFYMTFMKQFYC